MKDGFVKVAAATPRVRVADCKFNMEACVALARDAADKGAKLVVFPELSLTGYTCADLFGHGTLLSAAKDALRGYLAATAELDMLSVIGLPVEAAGKIYNCAAVCHGGMLLGLVPKSNIPNYSEFYEGRWFSPAMKENIAYDFDGVFVMLGTKQLFVNTSMPAFTVAVEICEDMWVSIPPSCAASAAGATVKCNLSASGEPVGKEGYRRNLVKAQSLRTHCGYVYSDAGEGESTTDIVFGGHAMIAENGAMLAEKKPFAHVNDNGFGSLILSEIDVDKLSYERRRMNTFSNSGVGEYSEAYFTLDMTDTEITRFVDPHPFIPRDGAEKEARCELVLTIQSEGLKTRIERARAKKIVVGISGGLDSCLALLVMARAIDLLERDRRDIIAVTMPCFGTTERTKSNATAMCEQLGVDFRCVNIYDAVKVHFADIGHDEANYDVVYENAQARERTQVLMDIANAENGLVVGTGDLSELALGWATYNGDHMSMYGVNGSVPKTLVRHLVRYCADCEERKGNSALAESLYDIANTPVSPELLPADKDGKIAQKTEDLVGPYDLHDFYLWALLRGGFSPAKTFRLAKYAFGGEYDDETVYKWLSTFVRRFFTQQFKRSCLPDGPKVGTVGLSPRGDWKMPSDASYACWQAELDSLAAELGLNN